MKHKNRRKLKSLKLETATCRIKVNCLWFINSKPFAKQLVLAALKLILGVLLFWMTRALE